MATEHPTDRLTRALIQRYSRAYQQTLERTADALRKGRSAVYYQAQLRRIEQELVALRRETGTWAAGARGQPGAIEQAWRDGAAKAIRDLAEAGEQIRASFAIINRDAVRITVQNNLLSLDEALSATGTQVRGWMNAAAILGQGEGVSPVIGRRVDDALRRVGLNSTAAKLTEGLSVQEMRRVLLTDLAAEGIGSIRDQAGRLWTLDNYAQMVARTTSREAYTQGSVSTIQRAGHDLVRISEHWPTCDLCAALQGRVISLSGDTEGWPTAEEVGLPPYHPNCLTAGHLVTTITGRKPIEHVAPGEAVLTHTGRYKPVTEAFCRPYTGEAIRLTVAGKTVTATPDHPFLTRRGWVAAGDLRLDDELCLEEEP